MSTLLLFSKATNCGTFRIETDRSTFDIKPIRIDCIYSLLNNRYEQFRKEFKSPYEAIQAVAGHSTGFPEWDNSSETVSDYAEDWEQHPSAPSRI